MRFAHRARTTFLLLATLALAVHAPAQAQGGGSKSAATSTSAAATPTAMVIPVPPTAVSADRTWPGVAIVYFGFTQSGMSYRIERTDAPYGSKAAATWQLRQTTGPLPCCSYSVVDSLSGVASNGVMYRVTTVSPTVSMRVPPSTISPAAYLSAGAAPGTVTSASWVLPPGRMSLRTAKVGTMVGAGGTKTITFNPSVVAVAPNGYATASGPGVTYVFWVDVSASGQPKVRGERITVVP
jgi:hypothetical protein